MTTLNHNGKTTLCLLILILLLSACSISGTETTGRTNTQATEADSTVASSDVASASQVNSVDGDGETATAVAEEPNSTAAGESITAGEIARPDGWQDETHSNAVAPNYAVVFPQDQVNTLTITIDAADWEAMLENMTELFGEPTGADTRPGGAGAGGRPGAAPPNGPDITPQLPEGCELPEGFVPSPDAVWPEGCEPELGPGGPRAGRPENSPGGFGVGGAGGLNIGGDENPDYVAATIEFNGSVWTTVGVRFKGNSTLTRGWNSGSLELPFKLDFDEFEDDYPEIDNQRFYGFKQLSLTSPSADESYVRTALAYDIMRDAGLIAPATAWYELFVDYGEGPVSFGLYTVVEVVDDSLIETAFGDDDGNIYEGDGTAASLAEGTMDQLADSFQKENNDESDYSDLEALYNTLHADTRLTDSEQWRADLEALFDVDTFLKWLAVNSVMVNWDTYGQMAHNYYLYHNPETDQLTWIGWDYNEALQAGRRGGTASLSQTEVTAEWPLIRYLLDEPIYYAQYVAYVEEVATSAFDADAIAVQLAEWEILLAPYLADPTAFATQIETITNFVYDRQSVVDAFVGAAQ